MAITDDSDIQPGVARHLHDRLSVRPVDPVVVKGEGFPSFTPACQAVRLSV